MKALSIRQPWAWLILNAGKDIENRDWPTKVRGRVLIHAAKGMTLDEFDDAMNFAHGKTDAVRMPIFNAVQRGGIVGSVEIIDCVRSHPSHWFFGKCGFVLRDPRPMSFVPYKGRLGFFDVPEISL